LNLYHEIIGICWLAFILAWGILAMVFGGGGKGHYSSRSIGARLIFFVAIFLGLRFSGHVPLQTFMADTGDVAAAGAMLCIAGLLFAIWARVVLGRNWGMPMTIHEDPELVTSGPYHYVRHPIYTGLIAMWIGTLLVYPPTALPGVAIIAYSLYSAAREERDMEQRFPEAYPEYRKRSKMLLPFLI
jgi:protein-S-isoprenylcysteine O-methyltransferase Ste14